MKADKKPQICHDRSHRSVIPGSVIADALIFMEEVMKVDFMEMLHQMTACAGIGLTIIKKSTQPPEFDMGIRRTIFGQAELEHCVAMLYKKSRTGVLYFVTDYFLTEYCLFRIPEPESQYGDFILIGPYRSSRLKDFRIKKMMAKTGIPEEYENDIREYHNIVPVATNIGCLREICAAAAQMLYMDIPVVTEHFIQQIPRNDFRPKPASGELSVRIIEERYALEAGLLKAIQSGDTQEAFRRLRDLKHYRLSQRSFDPVRDLKNILLSTNTLMRKAAENGDVHPVYVDTVSRNFAVHIESIKSVREAGSFLTELVQTYCLLVQTFSMKGHSPVVQRVVRHINLNLSDNLSLKWLAEAYTVNASYLSTLFRKEMGMTLTGYVNHQRIHYAILLLDSTNLQIQQIASECGIYDVNYFRKLFKKITGKTPAEYARELRWISKKQYIYSK